MEAGLGVKNWAIILSLRNVVASSGEHSEISHRALNTCVLIQVLLLFYYEEEEEKEQPVLHVTEESF
jgi:hypothetical protein